MYLGKSANHQRDRSHRSDCAPARGWGHARHHLSQTVDARLRGIHTTNPGQVRAALCRRDERRIERVRTGLPPEPGPNEEAATPDGTAHFDYFRVQFRRQDEGLIWIFSLQFLYTNKHFEFYTISSFINGIIISHWKPRDQTQPVSVKKCRLKICHSYPHYLIRITHLHISWIIPTKRNISN